LLIDDDGNKIGVVDIDKAINEAYEKGLDLVEVAPNARPPVCRMLNYGKYLYKLKKKQHEAKKRQKKKEIKVKMIKFTPTIEEHDYKVKLRRIREFLEEGNKVNISVFLRGRERAKPELGVELIKKVEEDIKDLGVINKSPEKTGRSVITVAMPKSIVGGDENE